MGLLCSQIVLKNRESTAECCHSMTQYWLDSDTPKVKHKCQNSPTLISSLFQFPIFQVSTCLGTGQLIITDPKQGRCFHTPLKAIPGCLLYIRNSVQEKKKSLIAGPSGYDLNLPVHYFHLIHQSCLCTLQTARASPPILPTFSSKVLLWAAAASPTVEPLILVFLKTPGLQLISTETRKTCSQTQGGCVLIFLKTDFLTLLPSASKMTE